MEGLPDMVPILYFAYSYLDIPEDIQAEFLVPQDIQENFYNDPEFEAHLADDTRYIPWSAEAIDQMSDVITQAIADVLEVDGTLDGTVEFL